MNDPYAVPCPTCLAHAGEPCSNRQKQLDFAHFARRRIARRRAADHARRSLARYEHPSNGSDWAFGRSARP